MKFTIKELCDFLETKVPANLKKCEDQKVKGINARYTTLEDGDVFFDINNDCEDLTIIDPVRCPAIISERNIPVGQLKIPVIKINHALDRYVALCKHFVDEYPNTIRIAVTGSTGKTSMKETIAAILGNTAATDKSFSNQNNIYFLSKRLQKVMPGNLRFYVQEACIKLYEDINLTQKLAIALQPQFVVMTNIFDNHAEIYGNRQTTFKIKSSLVEEMDESGVALLNMDDDILRDYHPKCQAIYYSLSNPDADIYASNISVSNQGTSFHIHWQGREIKNVFCPMIGRPNIYNCMAAFAIGSLNGIDDELLVRSIAKVNISYSLRQNHMKVGPYNLFIDCFNASLESIENDMKTMADLSPEEGGRKVVVIGDIAELGEKAESIHKQVGAVVVCYGMDRIFCFGNYSSQMYEGGIASNPNAPIFAFEDRDAMEKEIQEYIRPGDLILWKASRDTHIELSIDKLFGTDYYPLYPREYDIEAQVHAYPPKENTPSKRYYRMGEPIGGLLGKRITGCDFEYCRYDNGIKFVRYYSKVRNVVIPEYIDEMEVHSIGDRAFYQCDIASVSIPGSISTIATGAFLRCYNLRTIELHEGLKLIDFSAFAICTALESIQIPESCLLIRSRAFYQCKRLHTIVIEGVDTHLEERVFEEAERVRIQCRKGSLAEQYAIDYGITYSLIGDEDNWITPPVKEKEIVIEDIWWEEKGEKSRIHFKILIENKPDILWYEVDRNWKEFVNDDRIDGIVVSLLLFAIRGRFTKIRSEYPISEQLKYQLTYHLIPQIVDFEEQKKAVSVMIDAPTTTQVYEKSFVANGTGFSRGVDSFATLYEYGKNSNAPEAYKLNFLNVYNVGAFHGKDDGKKSYHFSRDMFLEQAQATARFAEEYGYHALIVDSNLMLFIQAHFNGREYANLRKFQSSATERNIGTTLLFQKLFSHFYYASGHTLKEFKLNLDESSALWEQYGIQFFSTENIRFYISNRDWTRQEKVERIVQLPEAYDNLQVCLIQSGNCGTCMKCKRTLMNLDILGEDILDRFSRSFDLEKYKTMHRKLFFKTIWKDENTDNYAKDILQTALANHSPLIQDLEVSGSKQRYTYRYKKSKFSVFRAPTNMSEEIALMNNDVTDVDLIVDGIYDKIWVKVWLPDGEAGYIHSDNIRIAEAKHATGMTLNAGTSLRLTVGKQYGFLPRFKPNKANEQVKYSIDDTNIAIVNKMGWVTGLKEGTATLTAISESGHTAQCSITIVSGASASGVSQNSQTETASPSVPKESLNTNLTESPNKVKELAKAVLPSGVQNYIKKNIFHRNDKK